MATTSGGDKFFFG